MNIPNLAWRNQARRSARAGSAGGARVGAGVGAGACARAGATAVTAAPRATSATPARRGERGRGFMGAPDEGSWPRQGPDGAHGDAAVDEKGLSGDVGAGLGGEEHHRPFEVLGLARAPEGDA